MQISAFTILALVMGASSSRAASQRRVDQEREAGELVCTEVESGDEGLGRFDESVGVKRGDGSRTWRWAGTAIVDRASRCWPAQMANRSPLLARVLNDAGYARAMLGSASLVLPVLGVALGMLAVTEVGGQALPPPFALTVALAVLGVFDALAGIVAVAVFVIGVVLSGGLSSTDAVRTLLGVATLWFAAPLIAGAARPLRRPRTMTFEEHFDRTADVVIASLVGAWAVLTILEGLPGLAGMELPIAERSREAALVVLAALILRMLIETAAAHWYPQRLARVQPAELPTPSRAQRMAASMLILAIFLFVAVSYLGPCWQLYVGAALFILPKVLELAGDRVPSYPKVRTVTPSGIVQVVVLLVIGVLLAAVQLSLVGTGRELIRYSFVLLAIPGAVLAALELVGREAPDREWRWQQQLLGIPLILLGVLLALGIIG